MEVADRPPEEPERTSPEARQAAYMNIFEGLILREISPIRQAANVVDGSDLPLAQQIVNVGFDLEQLWSVSSVDPEMERLQRESLLRLSMRSYLYSGLEVEPDILLFAAAMLDKNQKSWLRKTLEPKRDLLYSIFPKTSYSKEDRKQKREAALAVMTEMGIVGRLGRFAIRHL